MSKNDQNQAFDADAGGRSDLEEHISKTLLVTILKGDEAGATLDEIEEKVDEMDVPPELPPDERSLKGLMKRLDDEGRQALEIALGESLRIGHFWLGVEFLLMGLSKQKGSIFPKMLREMEIHPGQFRGILRGMVDVVIDKDWREEDAAVLGTEMFPQIQVADPDTLRKSFVAKSKPAPLLTPRVFTILRESAKLAGKGKVGHNQLLWATFQHRHLLTLQIFFSVVHKVGWSPDQMLSRLSELVEIIPEDLSGDIPKPHDDIPHPQGLFPSTREPQQGKSVLAAFGRDLTQLAREGKLHAAEGENARQAMAQIERILLQREAPNPILIGGPGVGKTAVVEGFAWRLAAKDKGVAAQLAGKRVIELSARVLTAGTKDRGDLEKRLRQLLNEVKAAQGESLVFIDEIHSILGGAASGGLNSIADAVKPALARDEFPCIGATTAAQYRNYSKKDAALAGRFTPVWIEEPSLEEAIQIVQKVATGRLTENRSVVVIPAAVEAAVKLSARYLHDERLPGKAIKVLDQACSGMIIGDPLSGQRGDLDSIKGKVVSVEAVLEVIAERTNIPVEQLAKTEKQRLRELEDTLKKRIIGQDEALVQVARVVKRAGAGLTDPRRPSGVFLFAGPAGMGQTELALALTEALFDREESILRLDMSEFMEEHQVARLTGAPHGYAGYEAEGELTGHLRRRPYSVVLLDKMEKAHQDVQRLFLQLFDSGRLTDSNGRLADGRNTIFIMTTNLGARDASGFKNETGGYQKKLKAAIDKHFSMEFIRRVDRIIYFTALDEDALVAIFDREFAPFKTRLRVDRGVEVTIAPSFKQQIAKQLAKKLTGARPLRPLIEDKIVAPLIEKVLTGNYKPGTRITIGQKSNVPVEKPAPKIDPGQPPKPKRPTSPEAGLPDLDDLDAEHQTPFDDRFLTLARNLLQTRGMSLEITDFAKNYLCTPYNQSLRGDRSPEQVFEDLIEIPLTDKFLAEEFQDGDWIRIDKKYDEIVFENMGGIEP